VAENTNIEWCDHTFNAWWGCAKVSPACEGCYAEAWAKRVGYPNLWGADADRRLFGDEHWNGPLRWDRQAAAEGKRYRVFTNSMADVFDNHKDVTLERARLWDLIRVTPNLDWLVLTKRIGNVRRMLPADWGNGWPNVWLGISIGDQEEAERDIPKLLRVPAALRFISFEPLLAEVTVRKLSQGNGIELDGLTGLHSGPAAPLPPILPGIDWAIIGGESGPGARPFVLGWAKKLVRDFQAVLLPVFMKQVGANPTNREGERCPHIKDRKGKNPAEWPEELRVREWPKPSEVRKCA
jgi:protein gp37